MAGGSVGRSGAGPTVLPGGPPRDTPRDSGRTGALTLPEPTRQGRATVIPAGGRSAIAASAAPASSSGIRRVTRSAGAQPARRHQRRAARGSRRAAIPWLPSTSSSPDDHEVHRHRGQPSTSGSRPTCTCRPRGARRRDGRRAGGGAAERVEGQRAPAAGRLADADGHVAGGVHRVAAVQDRGAAPRPGQLQRLGPDVDGDDPGAGGRGDHHGRQPDAAAAVHGHPLPGAHPAHLRRPPGTRSRTGSRAPLPRPRRRQARQRRRG